MDQITLTYAYDRKLWRRAMTGWWQSVVPPVPFVQRAIFWAVVWIGIAVLAGAVRFFGLTPGHVGTGLLGAGLLIAVFAYLQRTRMGRFWDVIGTHWQVAGRMRAEFDAEGVRISDDISTRAIHWGGIDAVARVRGATVLRSGISMDVIPDTALPEGLDLAQFRRQIADWRKAAA
ncbi:MAG: hypothetical protein OIF48_00930 [Silicimonas sp.]|nr:hypothetical protein [Silicimonas sp.]